MIKRIIEVPIYEVNIEFYYGTHKEISKINNDYKFMQFKKYTFGRVGWCEETNKFVMLMRNDINIHPGDVAHECKHLVNFIFIAVGITLDIDNDEAECYLLDWLVNKVHSIIKI